MFQKRLALAAIGLGAPAAAAAIVHTRRFDELNDAGTKSKIASINGVSEGHQGGKVGHLNDDGAKIGDQQQADLGIGTDKLGADAVAAISAADARQQE